VEGVVGGGDCGRVVVAASFVFGVVHELAGAVGCDQNIFYLCRARDWEAGEHDKPFGYYLRLLSYWRYGRGPIHSEDLLFLGWRSLGW
jgi:hypothetical protein